MTNLATTFGTDFTRNAHIYKFPWKWSFNVDRYFPESLHRSDDTHQSDKCDSNWLQFNTYGKKEKNIVNTSQDIKH